MINSLYSGYRRFCWYWWKEILNPRTYWKWCKWTWQRGRRGYADCDLWSLDSYVCQVMVPALKELKERKHGYPCPDDAVFDPATGDGTDEEHARWAREWDNRMDEMIAGFEAAYAVIDGPPDKFFTPRDPKEIEADQKEADIEAYLNPGMGHRFVHLHHYDMEGSKRWQDEQEVIRKKGFEMFSKWFYALWD